MILGANENECLASIYRFPRLAKIICFTRTLLQNCLHCFAPPKFSLTFFACVLPIFLINIKTIKINSVLLKMQGILRFCSIILRSVITLASIYF